MLRTARCTGSAAGTPQRRTLPRGQARPRPVLVVPSVAFDALRRDRRRARRGRRGSTRGARLRGSLGRQRAGHDARDRDADRCRGSGAPARPPVRGHDRPRRCRHANGTRPLRDHVLGRLVRRLRHARAPSRPRRAELRVRPPLRARSSSRRRSPAAALGSASRARSRTSRTAPAGVSRRPRRRCFAPEPIPPTGPGS